MSIAFDDEHFMRLALATAKKGSATGRKVGAIFVIDNRIVASASKSERYHWIHAEKLFTELRKRGVPTTAGTLYVTLSPCSERISRPPCLSYILGANPKRVVLAIPDVKMREQATLQKKSWSMLAFQLRLVFFPMKQLNSTAL